MLVMFGQTGLKLQYKIYLQCLAFSQFRLQIFAWTFSSSYVGYILSYQSLMSNSIALSISSFWHVILDSLA
jgi:hypothetical protein